MGGNTVDVGKEGLVGLVAFEIVAVGTAAGHITSDIPFVRVDTVNARVQVSIFVGLFAVITGGR
jgi:hypothetical protein